MEHRYLSITRDEHKYFFRINGGLRQTVLESAIEFARNPDYNFDFEDVMSLFNRLRG